MDEGFGYLAVLKSDGSGLITSVIAHLMADGPFRAVIWSVPRRSWIYAPALAVSYLYDDEYRDRSERIDRGKAEDIARTRLGTVLPSDLELRAICDEGEREGWDFGPPRTESAE